MPERTRRAKRQPARATGQRRPPAAKTRARRRGAGGAARKERARASLRVPGAAGAAGDAVRQQIVVSGVGGQGVLFVARLLAEAAIARGLPVLASETHGMAQRGGTVIAHLKVGAFASPLVRPGQADVLILLKEENAGAHAGYLRRGGWAAVNAPSLPAALAGTAPRAIDADALAREAGLGKAVNLIVLGRALGDPPPGAAGRAPLFCAPEEIRTVLRGRLARQERLLEASLAALDMGITESISARH